MTIFHDMLCQPTSGELELRRRLADTQAHAEGLEEKLMRHDPREATDPRVHSRICWDRQLAAHVWRKAHTLQSQLNGAENRRYSRGIAAWMALGFGGQYLIKGGDSLDGLTALLKFFASI